MTARRTALITGASAGIGSALAKVFAERNFDLVLVARRRERLAALADRLRTEQGATVEVLVEDLKDPAAPRRLFDTLDQQGVTVDALVNNAGFAVGGRFRDAPWQRQADCLQVLVTSVVELTHLFEPGMVARGYGRILNVASVAGLLPGSAGSTLYTPAKAFMIKFSEALAAEHRDDNVHVTALCPGYTLTEFHDVLGNRERMDRMPGFLWLDAEVVARQGVDAVLAGRVVVVNGSVYKGVAALAKLLPGAAARALLGRHSRGTKGH